MHLGLDWTTLIALGASVVFSLELIAYLEECELSKLRKSKRKGKTAKTDVSRTNGN